MRAILLAVLVTATGAFGAGELRIRKGPHLSWTDVLIKAEFVGVVECVAAGDSAGRYVVLESWKGAPANSELTLKENEFTAMDVATAGLVGDRFLVAAIKSDGRQAAVSGPLVSSFPPYWAALPADYVVPAWGVKLPLPAQTGQLPPFRENWGSNVYTNESMLQSGFQRWYLLRAYALKVIRAEPEGRELAALKAHAVGEMYRLFPMENFAERNKAVSAMRRKLDGAASVDELLLRARPDPVTSSTTIALPLAKILSEGGEKYSLKLLELDGKLPPVFLPDSTTGIVAAIQERLNEREAAAVTHSTAPMTAGAAIEDLERQIQISSAGFDDTAGWTAAFVDLSAREPGAVASQLSRIGDKDFSLSSLPPSARYALAANFASLCARDRETHLRTLIASADPYVRVAGAVYLAGENIAVGTAALVEASKLDGDPGTLAALALARRGKREFVPRALEALRPRDSHSADVAFHQWVQRKAEVFFSNSAAASRMTRPERDSIESWWTARAERVILCDPWRPLLDKLKLD